jgi:hypothetical protein
VEPSWQDVVGVAGMPIIVLLVGVLKQWVPDRRWWPVLAIAIGVAINLVAGWALGAPLQRSILYSLLTGAAAAGYYDARGKAPEPKP